MYSFYVTGTTVLPATQTEIFPLLLVRDKESRPDICNKMTQNCIRLSRTTMVVSAQRWLSHLNDYTSIIAALQHTSRHNQTPNKNIIILCLLQIGYTPDTSRNIDDILSLYTYCTHIVWGMYITRENYIERQYIRFVTTLNPITRYTL